MMRRFEAVCLAIKGYTLGQIAGKLHVSRTRVQQMIIQQAGLDFYEQLRFEHKRAKWAHYEFDSPAEAERKRCIAEINNASTDEERQRLKYLYHPILYGRR